MHTALQHIHLPVIEVLNQIQETLEQQNTAILSAPPGAGKSTLVPIELLNAAWLRDQKIIVLEPRRLAAKTVAMRMADLLNESVGETIGYRIRFETKTSSKTKIEVVTEGILTRMLQTDNTLNGVGLVIFDEFHERSIHADLALAFSRECQQVLRPELRILIMSATLNLPELKTLLNAPVVESSGKQFPVEINYLDQQDIFLLPEVCAQTAARLIQNKKETGDILIFLPGEGEIKKCAALLENSLSATEVHPLYGNLPPAAQMAAIMPSKNGKQKIVIATSIAETSITIEGVTNVIDCGYGRTQKFDARTGLSKLETILISKDSADQRAGRAGRLAAGTCYRLWSRPAHAKLANHRVPEILVADLSSLVLDLAIWGVPDVKQLAWLDLPPEHNLKMANELLEELGAFANGKITEHGKRMHNLPCHPRIAHMMLMAVEHEPRALSLAADIAALLDEKDPLSKEDGIDINKRITALRRQREAKSPSKKFFRLIKTAEQYRKLFNTSEDNSIVDPYLTGMLLVYAYPERIASARPGNNALFQLSGGNIAMADYKDDLAHEPWLAIAHLDAREGTGKIFMASPLNPVDLKPLLKQREVIQWNGKKGELQAMVETRLGSIVLKSDPLRNPDQNTIQKAILSTLKKNGTHLLDWNKEVTQFQNRILCLRKWNHDLSWPDVGIETLLHTCENWLMPYLVNIKTEDDLKKLPLAEILFNSIPYDKQHELNQLAPSKIEVPSGSQISLEYFANGSVPVLAVRIQEIFGLENTPQINQGKVNVLMHLLSPGYKPVQVTSDLKSFWQTGYFEVRKELKQRYPKHAWPDDPWNHPAIRGTKKQNGLK
ncbi:MAG: ATP-dependent helicase HrpB [Crocinitomicaceae bacterium]|nr:ATP-dependent helicase HrpB [Crocinitomicaceae bacterium]MBK8925785.1 ATP-dependent helicase HrpB [Crocinitomicaceae bacterium]